MSRDARPIRSVSAAIGRLSPNQFVMPLEHVLKLPSAEGWEGHETVADVLPMKHAENQRQLAEGEPFILDRQRRVTDGTYKALRVNTKGQLRDGHHTLALLQAAGEKYVRMTGGWRPWQDKDENEPDESWELTQKARKGELEPHTGAARWAPTSGIFAPTTGLDRTLFDPGGRLRGRVRHDLMDRLDRCLRVDSGLTGSDWQDWMKVYLAGGSASEWAGGRPNDQAQDLDVLVGVDYQAARGNSHFPGMTDEQIDLALNAAFRACFNNPDWHPDFGGTWGLTAYVNPQAYDIRAIKPYAAYDVSDMTWAVRPPHLPEHTLADFDPAVISQARAIASEARAILKLPEPLRTREATALWERLHAERRQAFSIEGEGWTDIGNVAEKWLQYSPAHLLDRIRALVFASPGNVSPGNINHGDANLRPVQKGKTGGQGSLRVGTAESEGGHERLLPECLQEVPQQAAGRADAAVQDGRHAARLREVRDSGDQGDVQGQLLPGLRANPGGRGHRSDDEAEGRFLPVQAQSLPQEGLRHHNRGIRGDAEDPERQMRDLQGRGGRGRPDEFVRRPQPRDGQAAKAAVYRVQLPGTEPGRRPGAIRADGGLHQGASGAGPWYHGTHRRFKRGDLITPGHPANDDLGAGGDGGSRPYVYAATTHDMADYFADEASKANPGSSPRVYEVQPTGPMEIDPELDEGGESEAYRSAHPLRVLREHRPMRTVDAAYAPGNLLGHIRDLALAPKTAAWTPGDPLYHGSLTEFPPGTVLTPEGRDPDGSIHSGDHVYATTSPEAARYFGSMHDPTPDTDLPVHVHRVEPIGDVEPDDFPGEDERFAEGNVRAKALRVLDSSVVPGHYVKTAAHVPEDEPAIRDRNDLGWGPDEWAEARREPWHKATQLAQQEVRSSHWKLTLPFPHGEEGDRMVGRILGYAGYKGPTEGAFAARHPDPSKMGSNPAWLNGKPGVALHPDRWDYGTVAHEAAHHAVMYDHAIAPNTPQTDEQVHGPEWAGHYAQALNRISKHAGDDFLYHHGRFRDMITDGLKYRRPSDLDAAEKHLPPSHWAEDHIYDPPTRLAAALELKGAAATHVGTPDHITYEHDKYGDGEHWFSAQHPEAGEVGHAHVFERSGPSGPHVEIKTLETNPHFRGRGIGTQLLGNVEKHFPGRELRLKPYPIDEDGDQTTEGLEEYYEGRGFEHRPLQEGDDLDLYDWMHKQASGWDEPRDDSDEDDLAGNAYGVYPDQDYYHGTAAALKPGDLITSPAERGTGHSRNVWFTSRRGTAGHYAIKDANDRTPGHPGHVYHVMPHASESEFDEAKYEGEYSTRKPLEVIGEEPFEHWRHEVYGRPVHQHPDGTWHPETDPQPHQAVKGYEGLTGRTAMIYLDLPPDAVHHLDGGVDDHHITVVYLGKNVSDDAFAEACRRAEQAAGKVRPLSGILRGVDTFPPSDSSDDKTPVFVPAYVPGIGHLRRLLEDLSASEHRNYRPHVTLAYLEPGDDLPAPHPKVDVRFSHLHVKRGDQVVSFPLGQSK